MTERSKYLFIIIDTLGVGGAETQILRLIPELQKKGWSVRLFTLLNKNAYRAELDDLGIQYQSLNMKSVAAFLNLWRLAKDIRKRRNKGEEVLIHSHLVSSNLVSRLVVFLAGSVPLVNTIHNVNEGSGFRYTLYRLTSRYADYVSAMSQAALDVHLKRRSTPSAKLHLVYNGVDTTLFKRDYTIRMEYRKKFGVTDDFVWLAAGNMVPQKNFKNLLNAWKIVTENHEEGYRLRLLIAGDGPLKQELEKFTQNNGLSGTVRFLGMRKDINSLMCMADAYVMSSDWEGFPMVLLEASATELPAVATDVGGNSEIIVHNETGFICPPKSSGSLSGVMEKMMLLGSGERVLMGENAQRYVEDKFGIRKIAEQWDRIYKELLVND